jgi:transcriptional regulator with XRE-family HTH domain
MNRAGELARSRAFHGLSEEDCLVWFGVGRSTLERIEAGEVEPSEELEQRIHLFLNSIGGGRNPLPPTTGLPFSHSGGPGGGGPLNTSAANSGDHS